MSFTEAGVLLDIYNKPIYWHQPQGRTFGWLPDSDALWRAIWDNRHKLAGFAHSHPGEHDYPSTTDISTFSAVELAIGRRLQWWISNAAGLSRYVWEGPDAYDYAPAGRIFWNTLNRTFAWHAELEKISNRNGILTLSQGEER